jgi:hypothetical protein
MAWTGKDRHKHAPAVQEVGRQGMLARLARTMDTIDPRAKVGRQRVWSTTLRGTERPAPTVASTLMVEIR